jgi:hypothetical protein
MHVSRPTINTDWDIEYKVAGLVELLEPFRLEKPWDDYNV